MSLCEGSCWIFGLEIDVEKEMGRRYGLSVVQRLCALGGFQTFRGARGFTARASFVETLLGTVAVVVVLRVELFPWVSSSRWMLSVTSCATCMSCSSVQSTALLRKLIARRYFTTYIDSDLYLSSLHRDTSSRSSNCTTLFPSSLVTTRKLTTFADVALTSLKCMHCSCVPIGPPSNPDGPLESSVHAERKIDAVRHGDM
ncbi:hypothetical protein FB567DRAFT_295517 [Paraphoma chrysanthemicola]|uniref:Uncharacterized protein n=1 Tax=Paraphoma chrysanthemicola TaxID=798071 RepID=A0A8K0RAR7_9PLEO|nr:hypothetical protein FB567DRAFT_295517 [Paraphoma chrysanthemicola]